MSRAHARNRNAAAALLVAAAALAQGAAFGQTPPSAAETVHATTPESSIVTGYDVAPRLQPSKYPLFPRSYVRAGKKASALIEYTVSAEGKAESVRILETDDPKFAGHLAAVIRHSEFKPGLKDGKAVRATMQVQFDLK